jgi:TRAP-type mannitol/chloroaromatic compound transport system substrate-binding protein
LRSTGRKIGQKNRSKEEAVLCSHLTRVVAIVFLGLCWLAPAQAQQVTKWKMMSFWQAGTTPQRVFEAFAERVKRMSGGRLVIDALAVNSVVAATESLDAVSAGALDGHHGGIGYWTGKDAGYALLSDPQGAFESPAQMQLWMEFGGGLALAREMYKRHGVYFVAPVWHGIESIPSKKPVRSLADFKGMKMRVPQGIGQEIFKALGASPVNIPGSEVYTSLERGVIDASDWGTLAMNQELGLHKLAKYPLYPGFHSMPMSEIAVNLKKWNALPDDLKAIVESAASEMGREMWLRSFDDDEKVSSKAKQLGIEAIDLPAAERRKFREHAQKAWLEFSKRSPYAKKVYDSQMAYLKRLGLLD